MKWGWVVLLLAAETAHAYTRCEVSDHYGFDQFTVPRGCPISFYRGETASYPTKLVAVRGTEEIDVTASVTIEMTTVEATDILLDCALVETSRTTYRLPIYIHRFELTDEAVAYDHLESRPAHGRAYIDPEGPCDIEAIPRFECANSPSECSNVDAGISPPTPSEGGCSSTRGSSWLAVLLLGLIPRRRLR